MSTTTAPDVTRAYNARADRHCLYTQTPTFKKHFTDMVGEESMVRAHHHPAVHASKPICPHVMLATRATPVPRPHAHCHAFAMTSIAHRTRRRRRRRRRHHHRHTRSFYSRISRMWRSGTP